MLIITKSILDLKVDCLFLLEKFEEVIKTADEYLESFGDNLDVLTNKKLALEELNRKKMMQMKWKKQFQI